MNNSLFRRTDFNLKRHEKKTIRCDKTKLTGTKTNSVSEKEFWTGKKKGE